LVRAQDDAPDASVTETTPDNTEIAALAQPILPPTTGDAADALDRQIYAVEQEGAGEFGSAPVAESSKAYAVSLHGAALAEYDDNVFSTKDDKKGDLVLAAEPGVTLGLGDFRTREDNYLSVDYTGLYSAYLDYAKRDSYQQFAGLDGQYVLGHLTLNTRFLFLDLFSGDSDAGGVLRRRVYETTQMAGYEIDAKQHLDFKIENIIHDYDLGLNSTEWNGRGFYDYQWDPKLTLGFGGQIGVLDVQTLSSQPYEQPLLHLVYAPSQKLALEASGGAEFRQLPGGRERTTPVFEMTANYTSLSGLTVSADAYRRVAASSSLTQEDFTATGVDLGFAKDLGRQFVARVGGGYEHNDYFYAGRPVSDPRHDNFFFLTPSIEYHFNEHVLVSLFYNYRENESSLGSALEFTNNQVGLRARVQF
jgi:hypothetical protein